MSRSVRVSSGGYHRHLKAALMGRLHHQVHRVRSLNQESGVHPERPGETDDARDSTCLPLTSSVTLTGHSPSNMRKGKSYRPIWTPSGGSAGVVVKSTEPRVHPT